MQYDMWCFFATAVAVAASPNAADYEVLELPGLESPPTFRHYSGLLPLGDAAGSSLFFWFVESAGEPATDPLCFWTNGGPGASSVAFGFWTEHGPWRLQRGLDGVIRPTPYPYSWNRRANVLYVEMPVGVGFSMAENAAHYRNITDDRAASDTFAFLLRFYEMFPRFRSNPLYLTGESYGGHYVPTLAAKFLDARLPHMRGFLIGNPGINSDWYYNVNEYAFVTFLWSHALIPSPAYVRAKSVCGWDRFLSNCSLDATHPSAACTAATSAALRYVPSPLDPYDVLAPTCDTGGQADAVVQLRTPWLHSLRQRHGLELDYDPCMSQLTPEYINQPSVLEAIHAPSNPGRRWPHTPPGWSYDQSAAGEKQDIARLFPRFFSEAPHWRIQVVSGTADAAVPFLGTERWMECLGREVSEDWRAWMLGREVGGMVKRWGQLSLVTVKGCGHTIPSYCPEAGYAMLDNFLPRAARASETQ